MSKPEQREVNIKTILSYPREAEVGQTCLMTVDVQAGSGIDKWDWPYAEEEYALYCILNTGQLFTQEPVGKPAIILNRFGGSYGPATFLLTASHREQTGVVGISLLRNGPHRTINPARQYSSGKGTKEESSFGFPAKTGESNIESSLPNSTLPPVYQKSLLLVDKRRRILCAYYPLAGRRWIPGQVGHFVAGGAVILGHRTLSFGDCGH